MLYLDNSYLIYIMSLFNLLSKFTNTEILKVLIGLNILYAIIVFISPYYYYSIITLALSVLLFYYYYYSNKRIEDPSFWSLSKQNLIEGNNYPKLYITDDNYLIIKSCTDNLWSTASKEKDNPMLNTCKDPDKCQNTDLTCENLINIINNQGQSFINNKTHKLPKSFNTFHFNGNGSVYNTPKTD